MGLVVVGLSACSPNQEDFKTDVKAISHKEAERVETVSITATEPAINLDVPFYSQAPDGDWGLPWKEACEEASIVLAHAFVTDDDINKEEFKNRVLGLVEWQKDNFSQYIDTNIEQTAEMLQKYLGHDRIEIIRNATPELIKRALAMGYPVVAPFAGRELGNPFFSGQGPYYHMLVIKGYDNKGNFITNDVGTRRGHDFVYPIQTIMNAMGNWGTLDINFGEKTVLVVK